MRAVSLLPAATEIVHALGAGGALVGVTHECDFPASVRTLPRVTRSAVADGAPGEVDAAVRALSAAGAPLFDLAERAIAALRPDVFLTQAVCEVCAVREGDVRALAARLAPSPAVVTLGGTTLDGVFEDVRRVAAALGRREAGERLLEALRARLRRVHETLKAAHAPRPRVAVIEWTDPLYAAGHWTPELVHRAGGRDVLARAGEHSHTLSASEVGAAAPEVVLVAPCGYGVRRAGEEARRLLARPEWRWARERGCRCWAVDGNALVSRPAPRLVDGVETFASIFAPALFDPPPAGYAVAVD